MKKSTIILFFFLCIIGDISAHKYIINCKQNTLCPVTIYCKGKEFHLTEARITNAEGSAAIVIQINDNAEFGLSAYDKNGDRIMNMSKIPQTDAKGNTEYIRVVLGEKKEKWEVKPLQELNDLVENDVEKLGVKVFYDSNVIDSLKTCGSYPIIKKQQVGIWNNITNVTKQIISNGIEKMRFKLFSSSTTTNIESVQKEKPIIKKQRLIWNKIVDAAKSENASEMISGCRKLIKISELDDSMAYKARLLMAKYFITTDDLNDIYESFLYFRYYAAFHSNSEAAIMRDILWKQYWEVVDNHRENNDLDGIYLCLSTYYYMSLGSLQKTDYSLQRKENWAPFYGVEILGNDMKIIPLCTIARWSKAYKSKKRKGLRSYNTVKKISDEQYDSYYRRIRYFVDWSDGIVSRGNTKMASTILNDAGEMRAKGLSTVAEYSSNTRENLYGATTVNVFYDLFVLLADLISTTREKGYVVSNSFSFMNYMVLNGELTWAEGKLVNGECVKSTRNHDPVFLIHIWPHMELYLKKRSKYICSRKNMPGISTKEYFKHYAATCYPLGNKYGHTAEVITKKNCFKKIMNDVNESAYSHLTNSFINSYNENR